MFTTLTLGCARFAENLSELTKTSIQAPQNVEFEQAIAVLKCEDLPSTNSTISGAQYNFSKTSTPLISSSHNLAQLFA